MKKKVLLIGWDAADWKVINPMIDQGLMPALESLINKGMMGNLSTLDPPFSPTLWTSISTGKRPYKHGIHGFQEPDPSGSGVRPVHITSRKVRAIWNILSNKGYKCHQVGWWPSHPAEPINGISISNFYQRANKPITEDWDMLDGTVHPKEKEELFKSLRIHPQELTAAHLQPFIPDGHLLNQNDPRVQKRLSAMGKILADCSTIHAAATYILDNEEWDFMAVYYDAIDHFSHGFMKFHPPQRPHIPAKDYEIYKNVVTAGYRFHDMMLETMMSMVPDDTNVILISDHGFYPNHLRPKSIPKEPAGPAYEHSPYGIIVAKGPDIKEDGIVYGASLLDITPTLLHLLGHPVGKDMDGKVLTTLFNKNRMPAFIPSYEELEGEFFTHPEDFEEDPEVSKEALQQLIDLGYIAAPGPNVAENLARAQRDHDFFKARSYIDGGVYSEAIKLLEPLHEAEPHVQHFSQRLANCYLQLKKTGKARRVVQALRSSKMQNNVPLLVLQARVLLQEKQYEKALANIDEAIALQPSGAGLQMYRGRVLRHIGRLDEAQLALLKALEHDPENNMAHHYLGMLYSKKEEPENAVGAFLDAIGLQFFSPESHFELGKVLETLEEYEAAANAYNNTIKIMPRHLRAKKNLHRIYKDELNRPQLAAALQASMPDYDLPEMVIVSGLPRSGTSMMMQMLEAAGMDAFTDGIRIADENNKKGYYEHERIKYLQQDHSILSQVGDKMVKIVAPLLFHLPKNYRYKIIFMERELGEVLLSQHKMLQRNKKKKKGEVFSFKLWQKFEDVVNRVKSTYENQPNASFLFINHRDVIEDPMGTAREVSDFLEKDFNLTKMAAAVDKDLYREREAIETA